jgi:hypothetical protein
MTEISRLHDRLAHLSAAIAGFRPGEKGRREVYQAEIDDIKKRIRSFKSIRESHSDDRPD